MADEKISALSDGGALQSTDEFVVARSGSNVKILGSANTVMTYKQTSITNADSPYTASVNEVIRADCSAGAIDINLPEITAVNAGSRIGARKTDGTGNYVNLIPYAGQQVDEGAGPSVLTTSDRSGTWAAFLTGTPSWSEV